MTVESYVIFATLNSFLGHLSLLIFMHLRPCVYSAGNTLASGRVFHHFLTFFAVSVSSVS